MFTLVQYIYKTSSCLLNITIHKCFQKDKMYKLKMADYMNLKLLLWKSDLSLFRSIFQQSWLKRNDTNIYIKISLRGGLGGHLGYT